MACTVPQLPNAASPNEEDNTPCKTRDTSRKHTLWQDRFRNPSQWRDTRVTKVSPGCPFFKQKRTREPLWMDSSKNPSWDHRTRLSRANCSPSAASQVDALVASLRACTKNKNLQRGYCIHDDILRRGFSEDCSDALVTMYAKCGALAEAKALLDLHNSSDAITWTALIAGYARDGQGREALDCFRQMQQEGILPDAVTYACILKACGSIGAVDKGKEIHGEIAGQGLLQNNIVLGGALVDMYAKCGALLKAKAVLEVLPSRNVIAWSALISGYVQEGQAEQALNCFEQMQHDGIPPNAVTYACILKSCASIGAAEFGKEIHNEIVRQGLLHNNFVLGGALVDMYAKSGALSMAQQVLEGLPCRNVVSWSSLIAGYAQEGQADQALNCFEQMQRDGIPPNAVTYACILKSCAALGAMDKGDEVYDDIARQGLLQGSSVLCSALVDMYAKCGALSKAQHVLEGLPCRDVFSWSALIAGYAQEGQAKHVRDCFEQMQGEGILPDSVTFACVLNVCSHLGLVEEGQALFMNMSSTYHVKPDLECYTCMIDLFGRAGHLGKAVRMIEEMPCSDYLIAWLALLGACWKWGDVNVGRWAFERAVQVEGSDGPACILMANIYAAASVQEKANCRAWKN